jgi:phage repressor protein C with HTH and peptisase S24 domain
MSTTQYGLWRHMFVQQRAFERALAAGAKTLAALHEDLVRTPSSAQLRLLAPDDPKLTGLAYRTHLPLYSLKAAAGYFGGGESVEPEGWIDATSAGRLDDQMFVAQVVGRSMEPEIFDGEYCVFRRDPQGSREGKIVLVQHHEVSDPETAGSYTVKRYHSEKTADGEGGWRHIRITLSPENREFKPIVLTPADEEEVRVRAEFLVVLGRS